MIIATWNINGVKARLESALAYLRQHAPDVVCLQEIKSVDEGFPTSAFQDLCYNVATNGQKGFNGVALLSKTPLEDVTRGLPGDEADQHARWIEASVALGDRMVRVVSLYLPNGNPIGRTLVNLGFTDATRACHPGAGVYTFWDYQAGAFQKDDGIRIDHILLSSQAADLLRSSGIDRDTRAQEKPSDHVPVWIKLAA